MHDLSRKIVCALLPLVILVFAACAHTTEAPMTTDLGNQTRPAISRDRIVWMDKRSGLDHIFIFDFAAGTATWITTDPNHEEPPAISGDRVVWRDGRKAPPVGSGAPDIFLFETWSVIHAPLELIADKVDQFVSEGLITDPGIAEALHRLLDRADAFRDHGNTKAATATFNTFIRLVSRQSGTDIDPAAAQILIGIYGSHPVAPT